MNRKKDLIYGWVTMLIIRGIRELLAAQWGRLSMVFPAPSQFIGTVIQNGLSIGIGSQATSIRRSIIASIYRVIAWITIATVSAILLWSWLAKFHRMRRAILPLIQLLAPIAPIAWISIALLIFGIGDKTAIFIVFMGVFFFLTLVVLKSIENVPRSLLQLSRTLGNTSFQTRYRVVLPSILPHLCTMLRINFMAAWMAVLAAEMTGLRDGLWAIIMTGRNLFDYDLILFGMFLIAIFGLLIDASLSFIQKKYFRRDKK